MNDMHGKVKEKLVTCLTTGKPSTNPQPDDVVDFLKTMLGKETVINTCPDG